MASNNKQTEIKRSAKARNAGRQRKRDLQKNGTTRSEADLFGDTLKK